MTRSEREALQRRAAFLGRGPALVPTTPGLDVALDLTLTADGRDFALVEGTDALVQDLNVALTTGLGADPFDQSFGFDGIQALADETDPILLRERIRVAVVRVLQQDRRVTRIRSVELDNDATAALDRRLLLTAVIEVTDGSRADLILSTGALR